LRRSCMTPSRIRTTAGQWRHARKQRYIAELETASHDALLVSACDKLHNARAVLGDLRLHGDALWQRFSTRSGPDQVWYYRSVADVFSRRLPGPLADELQRVVGMMAELELELRQPDSRLATED